MDGMRGARVLFAVYMYYANLNIFFQGVASMVFAGVCAERERDMDRGRIEGRAEGRAERCTPNPTKRERDLHR